MRARLGHYWATAGLAQSVGFLDRSDSEAGVALVLKRGGVLEAGDYCRKAIAEQKPALPDD